MRNLISVLIPTIAVVALSGCECESYYCDDTGCYYCDGIGCREVETPTRPTCRGDFECAEGICTDLGCVDPCADGAECADGYVCDPDTGLCLEPTEPPPTPNPGTCTTSADCSGEGLVCIDGTCQLDDPGCGPTGCSCDATGVCAEGLFCIDGECRAEDDICQFNIECAAGQQCVNGDCLDACDSDRPCAGSLMCVDGLCVEPPPVTGCTLDSECAAGESCIDSACYSGCTDDSMCDTGEYCRNGRCRADTRPDRCTADTDCRFVCDDGVCRVPCEDSNECAMVAVEFRLCLANFCATENQVMTDCASNSDCTGGEQCIDGVCQ